MQYAYSPNCSLNRSLGVDKEYCLTINTYFFNLSCLLMLFPEPILSSPAASCLSTLPFHVLRILFQSSELSPQEGAVVHKAAVEVGAIQMVLLCLAVLSHHKPRATNHSHKMALQALSALTGRYSENFILIPVGVSLEACRWRLSDVRPFYTFHFVNCVTFNYRK